jgi:hypothetical protein
VLGLKVAFTLAAMGATTATVLDIIVFGFQRSFDAALRVLGGFLTVFGTALGSFAVEWDEDRLTTWWPLPVIAAWGLAMGIYGSLVSRRRRTE